MLSRSRFAALFAIGAAVAVPMVGCGGSSNDSSTSNAATPASTAGGGAGTSGGGAGTVDLTATDFKFDPSDPSVKSGNVTFDLKNDGQVRHSLEIEDVNGEDKEIEGEVQPGQSGTLTVDLKPGTYEFYCPVDGHRQMGMTGELTVK
jgi:plastocyanin